jgi:hypothetical protein
MKSPNWKSVAEFVGVIAIVASLLFVGLQIRQDQNIAIAGTYGALTESVEIFADLVDRNADIWKKGLDGEELSSADKIRFYALAKAIQTHYSSIYIRWSQIGPIPKEVASRRYAYALYIYPGLRKARVDQLQELADGNVPLSGTFTNSLMEREADQFLKEFEEAETPIPSEKTYIFW